MSQLGQAYYYGNREWLGVQSNVIRLVLLEKAQHYNNHHNIQHNFLPCCMSSDTIVILLCLIIWTNVRNTIIDESVMFIVFSWNCKHSTLYYFISIVQIGWFRAIKMTIMKWYLVQISSRWSGYQNYHDRIHRIDSVSPELILSHQNLFCLTRIDSVSPE